MTGTHLNREQKNRILARNWNTASPEEGSRDYFRGHAAVLVTSNMEKHLTEEPVSINWNITPFFWQHFLWLWFIWHFQTEWECDWWAWGAPPPWVLMGESRNKTLLQRKIIDLLIHNLCISMTTWQRHPRRGMCVNTSCYRGPVVETCDFKSLFNAKTKKKGKKTDEVIYDK